MIIDLGLQLGVTCSTHMPTWFNKLYPTIQKLFRLIKVADFSEIYAYNFIIFQTLILYILILCKLFDLILV